MSIVAKPVEFLYDVQAQRVESLTVVSYDAAAFVSSLTEVLYDIEIPSPTWDSPIVRSSRAEPSS